MKHPPARNKSNPSYTKQRTIAPPCDHRVASASTKSRERI